MRHCNVAGREIDEVLLDGYLISYFQTGLKNLLDRAILEVSDFHEQTAVEKYKKLDELPFDFTRRMMSVLVQDPEGEADPAHQGRSGRGLPPAARISSSTESCPPWTRIWSSG